MFLRSLAAPALALTVACAAPARGHAVAVVEDPELKARLAVLVEQLEARRQEFHIPGMAIAVVKDDEIVLARGFGVSNIEQGTPATPETIYAIGSTTKAFTATLIGMLVEEGRMDWDDAVTEHLPYFDLQIDSDDEEAQATVRDLLCHRTGFTRMGILWAGGRVEPEQILRTAAKAEPSDGFREGFHYNNVMFLAAGMASAEAAGTSWDSLLRERLLEPLGMTSSTTAVSEAQKDPRLSLGYLWDEDEGEYRHLPMRVIDTCAPAGAINSNVLDMAQWIRFQLASGAYGGKRLIAEEVLRETWSPQIAVAGDVEYGLGWMLRDWNGEPVIEHGGNIDGFAAQVALLPGEDLGFVLLTNVGASPLQGMSIGMVWDALVGEVEEPVAASGADEEDLEPYTGEFLANHFQFRDATLTVLVKDNGKLAIDVPGQMVFELKEPDEQGKWYFALTDTIAASFERDDAGEVQVLLLHQHGLTFEVPRRGYEHPLELDLDDVRPHLGKYFDPLLKKEVEVRMDLNRLAVDVPDQMAYHLLPPDDEGVWWFRATPELGVRFNPSEEGGTASLTFFERGTERECEHVGDSTDSLPTREEIRVLCRLDERRAALERIRACRVTGTIRMANAGVEGTFAWTADGAERHLEVTDFGPFGGSRHAYGDGQAWVESTFSPFMELSGRLLEQARQGNPSIVFGDWSAFCDSFRIAGAGEVDGRKTYGIVLEKGDLPDVTLQVDAETGDTLEMSSSVIVPGAGVKLPYTARFEDFREHDGLSIPHLQTATDEVNGRVLLSLERFEPGVDVDAATFRLEAPGD